MSVQKQDAASIKVGISGVSGCGKTTLFEKLIRRSKVRRVFLYDHKQGDLARRFGVKPCFDEESFIEAASAGGVVCFNPGKHFAGRKAEGFEFFSGLIFDVCKVIPGRKIFGTDELDALVDTYSKPEKLCELLDEGRTFQIECYFICQAMNGIHNQIRKQISEIFCMKQGEKNGLEWFVERGFEESEIKGLKHGEFIYKNTLTGQTARGGKAFIPKNAGRDLRGL